MEEKLTEEEEISSGLKGLSITETEVEEEKASVETSVTGRSKRRADETPTKSSVPTVELFGAGAKFATGGSSKSLPKSGLGAKQKSRRKADEAPTKPSVPTAELFGSEAKFATRGRSKSRSRSGSRTKSRSRSSSRMSREGRTRSRSKSKQRSGSTEQMETKSSPPLESGSKFLKFFSDKKVEKTTTATTPGLQFFQVYERDFSHVNENSETEEILTAIEECGTEIQRLYTEVCPVLTGPDFLAAKLIQKSLISDFIKLLLLLNSKK
ncbi:putative Secreted Protein (SKSR family) [Cryptosporidium felis]|nr:putative Secreted Protein (SKSR family) [Cryptosporidium felis]